MKKGNKDFETILKTKNCWFVSDNDYEEMISKRGDFEIDNHTFKATAEYIFSFAMGIQCKPISQYEKKKIEYDDDLCEKIYEDGYKLSDDISNYSDEITNEQFEQWLRDNHCIEYISYQAERDYQQYNADKVSMDDLKDFLIQPTEPDDNPFKDYVKNHGNFMKKKCPYTYYCYDKKYGDYCILHLIVGDEKYNVWTKETCRKVYGVQKYCYNYETEKVNKLFIYGKPHVEVFYGSEDNDVVICTESFVKAFTLWNSLKKKYTIITTHSKYIRDTDLRWINENFKGYDLAILCDSDEETSEIVSVVRNKYMYYKHKNKNLKSIFGIMGNKKGKDINDSTRTAINMCKKYFENLEKLNNIKRKLI